MYKTSIQLTKVILFAILVTSFAKGGVLCSQKKTSYTQNGEAYNVNNRSALRKEQREREKNTGYWERQARRTNKAELKRQKAEAKEYRKFMKAGKKRHLSWQSDEVKKRLKKNEKKAVKAMQKTNR